MPRCDPAKLARYNNFKLTLAAALRRLPDHPGGPFRRAVDLDSAADWARYRPGADVTERWFTSSSQPFSGNAHFTIYSRHGKNVRPFSRYDSEREVLFTADSRFHVLRVYPEPEHNRTVIEMEEID